ncbi:MAG: FAD-dependent oxidoreductase [Planctomycetaceae bacterium]|nr:FAD-dependent oxidoreductase [Planctomycetaceae bacterium]
MQRFNRRDTIKHLALGTFAGLGSASCVGAEAEPEPIKKSAVWLAVDVLVCGGGPAGIAAAMMAGRQGAKVLLVERYGRLGGMAVQAMVGPLMGNVESVWVDRIVEGLGGRRVDYEFADLKYAAMLEEAGVDILLHAAVAEPLMDGSRTTGARLLTKQGLIDVPARVVVDATGDGDVAWAAGAEFEQGRGAGPAWSADGLVQPMSIMFRVSGVNHAESMDAHGGRNRYRFPDGRSWDQLCRDANAKGELPKYVGKVRTYSSHRDDERVINATQVNYVDGTKVRDLTQAELDGRRQVEPVLAFLRKYAPGFQNAYVSGMPAVIGVRETRRILGDDYLTVKELIGGTQSASAVVRKAEFGIDIHNPDGIGQAQGASEDSPLGKDPKCRPYDIPYGCLLPRGIEGLLVAGRSISGSHEAMASYRVQVIAMATGVAAGVAAAQAAKQGILPRAVEVAKIQEVVFATA